MDEKTARSVQVWIQIGEALLPIGVALVKELRGALSNPEHLDAVLAESDATWERIRARAREELGDPPA